MTEYLPASLGRLHPDHRTAPFWEAARRHELVACRCDRCATFHPMPPVPNCWECGSAEASWVPIGDEATVHTFTIVRQSLMDGMDHLVPFVIAVVGFDAIEGMRLTTNIVDVPVDDVEIGMKVRVVWDDLDDETTIPRFTR
jgi:uncharacterized OB-fold protein